ncbi:hypothetical protein TBR22_A51790 [Luteitalea sp. TBR-22]|nr:hypothetical protein TBR22_A51790 [Luteitalea sp. TBR-22]
MPPPGTVAGLTVQDETTALWCIACGPRRHAPRGDGGATLGPETRGAWHDAGVSLPRAVPVLWRSVHEGTAQLPRVTYLASASGVAVVPDVRQPIDGPSFGLAFGLALASRILDCAVPGDVIATATLDATGRVGPVGGLAQKLRAVGRMAPSVRRVLVAAAQQAEAQRHAAPHVEVIGVSHAAAAIDAVFGRRLAARLVEAGDQVERREELTGSFFRLALMGSEGLVDWRPVRRGARLALDRWKDLGADARYRLEFAEAVAARHVDNGGRADLPPPGWLDGQPRPIRVQVVAHLVQQCADAGTPVVAAIEPIAASLLDHPIAESSPAELRLRGAVARLLAVTGRPDEARRLQEQVALAFAAIYADQDVAYPLAEWARLAGVLGDVEALARAERAHDRARSSGGYRGLGPRYVDLALVKGALLVDPTDAQARRRALALGTDPTLPDTLRWSALRWAGGGRAALERATAEGDPVAGRQLVLARLDEAVRAGDPAAVESAMRVLARYDPGPVGHLRRAGASSSDIARLYPY